MKPTQLLIVGNPKPGTPLMQGKRTIGVDLPLKARAWQDDDGKVWLGLHSSRGAEGASWCQWTR